MNVLVIDTATEACSVALQLDEQVFHRFEICPQQHSQRILPMIDEILQQANCSLDDLDYLAFGQGPGSFTGVRIATGVLQGLALGTGLKVVGISTLAAMAQQAYMQYQSQAVVGAIDARMDEVYFARYHVVENVMTLTGSEQVLSPEAALSLIAETDYHGVGTGWQAYPILNKASQLRVIPDILYPDALYMLPLAMAQIKMGHELEVEDVSPVYLRDKVTWKKLPGRE